MADQVSLYVRFIINLRTIAIRTSTDSTVAEFKLLVALHFDVPVDRQRLFHNNRELRDYQTIENYGLQDGHVVYLLCRSHPGTSSASTSMAAAATSSLGGNGAPHIASKVDSVQNQGFGGGNSASLYSGLDGSSDATVPGLLINIQDSSETKFAIRVRPELTVGEFKGLITQLQNIPVNEQRLIYSGQFLQDDKSIGSYGVHDGDVMHLARRLVPATSCTSASVAAAPPAGGNSIGDILNGAGSAQSQGLEGEASSLFGYVLPGFEQLEQPISDNPNMVIGMTTIPAIQNLLDDPRISRIIIANNVWILESMDPHPEVVYLFNNPGAFRLTMETLRNLEQIRAMVRDSTMSNTESSPEGSEGSNMLRQRYDNVHEPLPNALPNPWGVNAGLDAQSSSFIDPASRIQALRHPATFGIRDEVMHNDPQSSSVFYFNPQVVDALQNPETPMSQLASHRRFQRAQVLFASPQGSSMSSGTGQTAGGSAFMFDGPTAGGGAGRPEEYHVNQLLSLLNEMGFMDNGANLQALNVTNYNIGTTVALLLRNLGR